jgi:serine/threonine-protein kinase
MGFVYKAHDRNLDNIVVIKSPRRMLMADPEFAGRFEQEIRSLVKLSHPHIVKVMDVGSHDGVPFAVMQFLSGGSIEERIQPIAGEKAQPIAPSTVVSWIQPVAQALDFMHKQGYVHRDIKPGNVLFDEHDNVFLSDFGVAKVVTEQSDKTQNTAHTSTGLVMGTPDYLAPELMMGGSIDGRVDQYSLAIMVHELICGEMPFQGATAASVMVQHSTKEPPAIHRVVKGIPKGFSNVVMRALSKNPTDRFESCTEFATALKSTVSDESIAARKIHSDGSAGSKRVGSNKIRIECPGCGKSLSIPASAVGKRARCKSCDTIVKVPKQIQLPSGTESRTSASSALRTEILSEKLDVPTVKTSKTKDNSKRR